MLVGIENLVGLVRPVDHRYRAAEPPRSRTESLRTRIRNTKLLRTATALYRQRAKKRLNRTLLPATCWLWGHLVSYFCLSNDCILRAFSHCRFGSAVMELRRLIRRQVGGWRASRRHFCTVTQCFLHGQEVKSPICKYALRSRTTKCRTRHSTKARANSNDIR
ncbi:hypothetical protein IWZ01DRAFT_503057 [Phyllosticta capitalensis]